MIEYKNIYFIGIGGIGMSAIARMLKTQGVNVSGSDLSETSVVKGLRDEGVKVNLEQVAENIDNNIDCVVYTTAIGLDNYELIAAKEKNIPIYKYSEMLGKISDEFQTVAISGTHGKTTTTAMTSHALRGAGLEPHTIVGSLLSESKSNYVKGGELIKGGDILVTEACEYQRSFLNLNPKHLVITNIEEDHLDYYKDLKDIQSAFIELAEKLPEEGKIVCDPGLPNLKPFVEKFADKIIDYREFFDKVPEMKVIGHHNKLDAAAALAVSSIFFDNKEQESSAIESLKDFKGTWRRLEDRGETSNGTKLFDDYAHHPDEILVSIKALKEEFSDKKISLFFQPHLYSRTKLLLDDFIKVFSELNIDNLYLLPIYAAREPNDPEISSEILSDKTGGQFVESFEKAAGLIKQKDSNTIAITMGAGDVYKILDLLD